MEQGSSDDRGRIQRVETREKSGVPTRPLWGRADPESPSPPWPATAGGLRACSSPLPPAGTALGGALPRVAGGAQRLTIRDVVREVGAEHEPDDVVDLRGGLDDAVPPAVRAEGLARQLERTEVLPALRAVDARGERERGVTTTSASVVVAVPLPAATGAAEELSVRGRTRGHRQGSRPPCATLGSYHGVLAMHAPSRGGDEHRRGSDRHGGGCHLATHSPLRPAAHGQVAARRGGITDHHTLPGS